MKALLVCTDFSESAFHAAEYALMLARNYKINDITLFNAYQTVLPTTGLPVSMERDLSYQASIDQLKELKDKLQPLTDSDTLIRIRAEDLSLSESINDLCVKENADMVVMGMSGKSKLEKVVIGSNTVNVSQNSRYPVLIVPANCSIRPITRILIASDLSNVSQATPLEPLDKILNLIPASLIVLNVDYKNRRFLPQTADEMHQLHYIFDKYKPEYAFIDNEDTAAGILDYAEKNDISIIVTIPKNYNLLEKLFHKSTTQKLIYKSAIPLLSLHEQP